MPCLFPGGAPSIASQLITPSQPQGANERSFFDKSASRGFARSPLEADLSQSQYQLLIRWALAQGVSDHELSVFIATFVMSVKQLLHFLDFVATFLVSV